MESQSCLISMSLMAKGVQHLWKYSLSICVSSIENCLFVSAFAVWQGSLFKLNLQLTAIETPMRQHISLFHLRNTPKWLTMPLLLQEQHAARPARSPVHLTFLCCSNLYMALYKYVSWGKGVEENTTWLCEARSKEICGEQQNCHQLYGPTDQKEIYLTCVTHTWLWFGW